MHRRRVAHGNLKPGNVFLQNDGAVLLADWAMGNMPGIGRPAFTDAVLYQPPEQLHSPEGYLHEEGYRWDVHAFGALAFRLLTGHFPRCDETFSAVAPPPGECRRDDIQADLPKIADNLEKSAPIAWPDGPANAVEAGFRELIGRCLALDPHERPASMIDVVDGFARVEHDDAVHREHARLLDQRRAADRRARHAFFAFGMSAAAAVVMAALWQLTNTRLDEQRAKRQQETTVLAAAVDAAEANRNTAETTAREANEALEYEREVGLARLQASRETGDVLFKWAMEKGHRRLPPLDGREQRLKRLERYFIDFVARTSSMPQLAPEHARAHLQLAEISLAAGDAETAASRLDELIARGDALPDGGEHKLRMARNALLLALLHLETDHPNAADSFKSARLRLEEVPLAEVDSQQHRKFTAILDFHEAKILAAAGDDAGALERLMAATRALNDLADERPDAAVLRSELAECYLASATILEGIGNLGDARETRELAAAKLHRLLEENPDEPSIMLDLAGCIGAMAEAAVLSGDIAGASEKSAEAIALLDRVIASQPDNHTAISRKAAQLGLRAGILRDQGRADEALADFDLGIRMLEAARAAAPAEGITSYRLALLIWQKARMVGIDGDRQEEITMLRRAAAMLVALESSNPSGNPRSDQIRTASAYLHGDLGHAQQLAGDTEAAINSFTAARLLWSGLAEARPQIEEYRDALAWCDQRLAELNK
jgi:tetratricopeptide (TPR) repeat protein